MLLIGLFHTKKHIAYLISRDQTDKGMANDEEGFALVKIPLQ